MKDVRYMKKIISYILYFSCSSVYFANFDKLCSKYQPKLVNIAHDDHYTQTENQKAAT